MRFAEVPLAEAEGAVLAHAVVIGGRRAPKGTPVDAALLADAMAFGVTRLWVARLEAGDVPEAEAAMRIGAVLAGAGVEARAPVHGRVNLHATCDGLLQMEPHAMSDANAISEAAGIATLPPSTPVRAGDLLATVKIIPFALAGRELDAVLAIRPVLEVLPWRDSGPVLLLQTMLPGTPARMMAKTAAVTRDRLARFGWSVAEADPIPHAVGPLSARLADASGRHGLILVAGATATADRRDVIPAAIAAAGGQVSRLGMPVDPGNLLVLGGFGPGGWVIGLPGCAKSPKRNGLDLVLERIAAFGCISPADIARMGVGGLLEGSGMAVPWAWQP